MKIRKPMGFGLLFAFLLSLASGLAFGWGSTWMGLGLETMVNAARWKLGPFRYNGAFQLTNAGYDTDIYFGMLDKRVPDWTLTAGPVIQVFLPLKNRIVFDISESPSYVFFSKTDRERAWNHALSGNMYIVFDRFYFQAGGGLSNARQRLSTELNINVRMKQDSLSGLALWQASRATSFAVQYQRFKFDYENQTSEFANVSQNLNRTESSLDLITYIQPRTSARFYLDGEYGEYKFAESASFFKNSRSYGISGGVQFVPPQTGYQDQTSGTRGSVDLGYQYLDVRDPAYKDYSGLAGSVSVSMGIMRFTALRLFFSSTPQFSAYSTQIYYRQMGFGAGLSRALSRRVLFTYDFGYSQNSYPAGEVPGGGTTEKTMDRYATHAAQLDFRLRRDLQISLLGNLGRRHSDFSTRAISKRAFIGLSLTYGYLPGVISMPAGPLS